MRNHQYNIDISKKENPQSLTEKNAPKFKTFADKLGGGVCKLWSRVSLTFYTMFVYLSFNKLHGRNINKK